MNVKRIYDASLSVLNFAHKLQEKSVKGWGIALGTTYCDKRAKGCNKHPQFVSDKPKRQSLWLTDWGFCSACTHECVE